METQPKTRPGQESCERIVVVAADLMLLRGVCGTGLDEVRAAAGMSKSQLYHYVDGKAALVQAVIACQTECVMAAQEPWLDSWTAIAAWFDALVAIQDRGGCAGGCPLGSPASALSDIVENARPALAGSFDLWEDALARGSERMHTRGELQGLNDPAALAPVTMASLQGGLLLTRTREESRPPRLALDAALSQLRSFATDSDAVRAEVGC